MGDVREERALRLQLLDQPHRVGNGRVRGMRTVPDVLQKMLADAGGAANKK